MKIIFSDPYGHLRSFIEGVIAHFGEQGRTIYKGRNEVKVFQINHLSINIKAFKRPNWVNRVVYRYFRKSKAERSFEYAQILLKKEIKTPPPIAYLEESGWVFGKSYYVSEQLDYDYTFRDLFTFKDLHKRNEIIQQFAAFTFDLHEKGVEFLDHSPGNTLIVESQEAHYDFYLVDLNRMRFHEKMSLEQRIHNMRRMTENKDIVRELAYAYAPLIQREKEIFFTQLWAAVDQFFTKYNRKHQLKNKLKLQ